MDAITAIYINRKEDQLVLKTSSLPNIVILVEDARDVLRTLYAIKFDYGIPVYQLDYDELDQFLNNSMLPPKRFQAPVPEENYEWDSDEDVDESPTKTPKLGMHMSAKVMLTHILYALTNAEFLFRSTLHPKSQCSRLLKMIE